MTSRSLDPIRAWALHAAASSLSPAGRRARLFILIYHRVRPVIDPLLPDVVDAASFSWQMHALREHFNVLPLSEAAERLAAGNLPARAACITFDDGYADNADVALPILHALGLRATFFVASGYLNGGRMWNDSVIEAVRQAPQGNVDLSDLGYGRFALDSMAQRTAAANHIIMQLKYLAPTLRNEKVEALASALGARLPRDLMMDDAAVKRLHDAGMEIGGHTVNHPILARIALERARQEIADGRERLEALIGEKLRLFAYPNGFPRRDYLSEHVRLVKELGFRAAVSTAWGTARQGDDLFQLPRFTPWGRTPFRFLADLLWYGRRGPAQLA